MHLGPGTFPRKRGRAATFRRGSVCVLLPELDPDAAAASLTADGVRAAQLLELLRW
jgi:hypothetical protein